MMIILTLAAILYLIFGEDDEVKEYCKFYLIAVGLITLIALV